MRDGTDWQAMQKGFRAARDADGLRQLAEKLGVSEVSLERLRVGWSDADTAWTFPERDGAGQIIGIVRRFADGSKKAVSGSRRGLYLPQGWDEMSGPVYVPEGASDVAALLTVGLSAVGRPSATGGVDLLAELLEEDDREVIVVGDNDEKSETMWPGRDGARKAAEQLARLWQRPVSWTLPPDGAKDVREWIRGKRTT